MFEFEFKRKKTIKIILISVILIATFSSAIFLRNKIQKNSSPVIKNDIIIDPDTINQDTFITENLGANDNKEQSVNEERNPVALSSQHYKIKAIALGDDAIILAEDSNDKQLNISDVRSEVLVTRKGDSIRLLISWNTNKLSKSEIKYSKNSTENERKISENGFSFAHAVVLTSMEPGSRYIYSISANDQWGNAAASEKFNTFIAKTPPSVFDMISNEFDSMFGWALK